ncbi:M23 family metallopeptidase [Hyphomonas sp.]|uniref:M23 family metallopeptidase n=1 Tax=Hyphomonas sp. TaxID=87 RepID=UPI00391DE9BE
MRAALCLIAGLALAGCSESPGQAMAGEAGAGLITEAAQTIGQAAPEALADAVDSLLAEIAPDAEAAPSPEPAAQACSGILKQGGLIICDGAPGDVFHLGSVTLTADETGSIQFGLARQAPLSLGVRARALEAAFEIAERRDELRTVPGFDCDRIDARTPEQRAHAARSWEIKQAAFAAFHPGRGALDGFIRPSSAPPSSPFGPARRYIGVSKTSGEPCESMSVHQGYDMAAPVGTPVVAPAAGVVTLADPDLYYEGGTIFLDHGHGLLSVFMHLSEVNVAPGDVVARGAVIAKTGNTGRSTGPHLHWGVKWRNPASENRGADFYIDPALLLDLPVLDVADAGGVLEMSAP